MSMSPWVLSSKYNSTSIFQLSPMSSSFWPIRLRKHWIWTRRRSEITCRKWFIHDFLFFYSAILVICNAWHARTEHQMSVHYHFSMCNACIGAHSLFVPSRIVYVGRNELSIELETSIARRPAIVLLLTLHSCTHTNKQLNLLHQQINIFGNYFVRATNPYGKTY